MRKINIMTEWKEFNTNAVKSLREAFVDEPYPEQWKILRYLRNGKVIIVASCVEYDVITREV